MGEKNKLALSEKFFMANGVLRHPASGTGITLEAFVSAPIPLFRHFSRGLFLQIKLLLVCFDCSVLLCCAGTVQLAYVRLCWGAAVLGL